MKIACLQFESRPESNKSDVVLVDAMLRAAELDGVDLLVLSELNIPSTGCGQRTWPDTSQWLQTLAETYNCVVVVVVVMGMDGVESATKYSSISVVSGDTTADGPNCQVLFHPHTEHEARKKPERLHAGIPSLGQVSVGISEDLDEWHHANNFNFARHVIDNGSNLVVLSMSHFADMDTATLIRAPELPDTDTLRYWLGQLKPIFERENTEEIICVIANRTGLLENSVYAGTSVILGIKAGCARVYGLLSRGDEKVLVADTDTKPLVIHWDLTADRAITPIEDRPPEDGCVEGGFEISKCLLGVGEDGKGQDT
ncbi:hypothetical protein DL95DRAFT_529012 [Leptodontidium sp. 2 PMI_412]|nr:hypothetical protein DL95DRAFT_529012 [Leptodontidium sp. 2 PMI_412]